MRPSLLALAFIFAAAAAYFAWDRGASDLAAIGAMLLAVLALGLFQLTPPSKPDTRLRAPDSEVPPPATLRPTGSRARVRTPERPAEARTPAERRELSELAANLDAVADQRGGVSEADVAGRSHVDLVLVRTGSNQIAVIKELRQHLGYGLKEAKDLTDEAKRGRRPAIARQVPAERARNIARAVSGAGGKVELV